MSAAIGTATAAVFDLAVAQGALLADINAILSRPAAPDVTSITVRFIERDIFADYDQSVVNTLDWSASIDTYAQAVGAEIEVAFPGALVLVLHDNRPGFLTGDEMIDIEATDGDERAWAAMTVAHIATRVFYSTDPFGLRRWMVRG